MSDSGLVVGAVGDLATCFGDSNILPEVFCWLGIFLCLALSALFSGLTLGLFSLSRLRLEILSEREDADASRVLAVRKDANFLLASLLWGNVAVNVSLALLSDSAMSAAWGFCFSVFGITLLGEILPQACFSRHALVWGSRLSPFVRAVGVVLYPLARPSALFLDRMVGREGVNFMREEEVTCLLEKLMRASSSDVDEVEARGAINFLLIDELPIFEIGKELHPASVITLAFDEDGPVFPPFERTREDPFIAAVDASKKPWVFIFDQEGRPRATLDADWFLREVFLDGSVIDPKRYLHIPVVVEEPETPLSEVLTFLRVKGGDGDDVVDHDVILVHYAGGCRIVTLADVVGRLLRGIVSHEKPVPPV